MVVSEENVQTIRNKKDKWEPSCAKLSESSIDNSFELQLTNPLKLRKQFFVMLEDDLKFQNWYELQLSSPLEVRN